MSWLQIVGICIVAVIILGIIVSAIWKSIEENGVWGTFFSIVGTVITLGLLMFGLWLATGGR